MPKTKTLEDLTVTELDKDLFAIDDPVYILVKEGKKLIDLPHGSLIYTGQIVPSVAAGFFCGICMVWEGKNVANTRKILIRNVDPVKKIKPEGEEK